MVKTIRKGNWYEIIIPEKWSTYTVDHLLRNIWKTPKKLLHTYRMEKMVLVNNEAPNWNRLLATDDRLQLNLFQPDDFGFIPSFYDVDILFEDEHLLIFNKPAGMDTHPNNPSQNDTLANAAAFHLQAKGETLKIQHIHRLDRDTTGAVLFAKTALAGAFLDRLLAERKINRTYLAITEGIIGKDKGTINKPIGRDRHHPVRRRISRSGQVAITHYKILKLLPKENRTVIQCSLETGRTHQIRAHLSDIGHPLVGDTLYGGSNAFPRQALHAVKIELPHPFTGDTIVCHAPFIDAQAIFKEIDPYSV